MSLGLADNTTCLLSGIHDAVGVVLKSDMPVRIRCGGLVAFAGYGMSQACSAPSMFCNKRICFPSGENLTMGVLKGPRDAKGAGSYGVSAAPARAVHRVTTPSGPPKSAAIAAPSRETDPLLANLPPKMSAGVHGSGSPPTVDTDQSRRAA